MIDPWIAMVRKLVPNYEELRDILEMEPKIEFKVTNRILTVSYPADVYDMHSSKVSECIEWCTSELLNWDKCHRLSWNQWKFSNSANADKFLTLLNLKWK